MDIIDKIHELQDKYRVKNKVPCPTPVLLFLAEGMVYPGRVDPWYTHLKEDELLGAPSYATDFFKAVICGMYPELEKAAETLKERLIEYKNNNRELFEGPRNQRNRRKNAKNYLKITAEVMRELGLQEAYQIFETTQEQRKRIDANLKVVCKEYNDERLKEYQPIIQLLGQAVQPEYLETLRSTLRFDSDMSLLNGQLKMGKENFLKKREDRYWSQERIKGIAEQIFDLQEKGIIDDKFRVRSKRWQEFQQSDLVQKFTYNGKEYCLKDKILTPFAENAQEKGAMAVDNSRSDL